MPASKSPIRFISTGLILLVLSSMACSISIKAPEKKATKVPTRQTVTKTVPTEEVYVFPTLSEYTVTPTEEELAEWPTEEPTATLKPVKKTPTRTVPPPEPTEEVIYQSPIEIEPTREIPPAGGDITVTAATGNLFIRRGPGTTYNIVSGLSKGTTTKAVGRNEKNDWLAIEIPKVKGAYGWISMGTGYTEMSGSITSLPLFPYDEAKPAYIQNCTHHDMTTRPGQWNLPGKTTQKVNPGEYAILDMVTGQNKVQEIDLKEGNTARIKVDGDGANNSCP